MPFAAAGAPDPAVTRKDNTTAGNIAHRANLARTMFGVDGTGIGIGVISDGVRSVAERQASGDLPARVTVLPGQEGGPLSLVGYVTGEGGDEGTAMLEIVHDLAPGAELYFATGRGGQARMAANVEALCEAGADIIVDDIFYLEEAVFQDGTVAQSVNAAVADGCVHFSAAGNAGNLNDGTAGVWEGDYAAGSSFIVSGAVVGTAHDFGGGVERNRIAKDGLGFVLQWADPLGASANDYDLFLVDANGNVLASSTDTQDGSQDPIESISSGSDYEGAYFVVVKLAGAADRYVRLDTVRGQLDAATAGQTARHAAAESAMTVGAVDVRTAGAGGVFDGTVIGEGMGDTSTTDTAVVSGATYTYQVTAIAAGGSATHSAPQTVTVVGNRPPTATGSLGNLTSPVPDGSVDVVVSGAFLDPDNDVLVYGAVSSAPTVATVSVSGSTVTVTPLSGGMATITVTATDVGGSNTPAAQTFVVTVPNRPPVVVGALSNRSVQVSDGVFMVVVSNAFQDPDGDALTYGASSSASSVASVTVSGSTVSVTPLSGGTATVTVTATDAGGSNMSAMQTFEVTVANRSPEAVGTLDALSLRVPDGARSVNVSTAFRDPDGDTLSYPATSSDTSVATVSVSSSTVEVTPVSGGTATITVTAADPDG